MATPTTMGLAVTTLPQALSARKWVTASLAATTAGFGLALGFVMVQGVFAPLSDLAMVASAGSLLPVAWYLHRVQRVEDPSASGVAVTVGTAGLSLMVVAGLGLAFKDVTGIQTQLPFLDAQHLGLVLQGGWMALAGLTGLRQVVFRRVTSAACLVAGIGYAVGAVVNLRLGFEHPLFYVSFLVALAGFVTWALALRTDLKPTTERSGR
ncbi:MAG: hypothetical protein R6X29_03645 [Acidimicrobiia bacterium]